MEKESLISESRNCGFSREKEISPKIENTRETIKKTG